MHLYLCILIVLLGKPIYQVVFRMNNGLDKSWCLAWKCILSNSSKTKIKIFVQYDVYFAKITFPWNVPSLCWMDDILKYPRLQQR